MTTKRVDLSKVPVRLFVQLLKKPDDISVFFDILETATEGASSQLPMTDLPALMAELTEAFQIHANDIVLAIAIMGRQLGNDGD